MTDNSKNPAYSKNVLEMILVANEYCKFIEDAEKYSKEEILNYLQKVCPLLYLKGSLLPDIKLESNKFCERFVTEEHWEKIFISIKEKLKEDNEFWKTSDVKSKDEIPVKTSIAEEVADIYQDLKDFIILYQKNSKSYKESAVAECNFFFKRHWGIKVNRIINVVHHIIYKKIIEGDNYMYFD
ncbi:MAG: DUF5063 domain-containing protein [Bacteroidales bacterium]|nr:DUF5063 domain-containing protein [Bacteroidales bacterium]